MFVLACAKYPNIVMVNASGCKHVGAIEMINTFSERLACDRFGLLLCSQTLGALLMLPVYN